MKIGVDISQIAYPGTGVGRFTGDFVDSLLKYDKKNQYTFFFSSLRNKLDLDLEKRILSIGHCLIKWKLPPSLLSFVNNDIHSSHLSSLIYNLSSNLDWFVASDWTEPSINVKKTTIVHDLVFKRYPETLDNLIVSTQEKRLKWVNKESKIIFVDSQSTKDDLISYCLIEPRRIVVNYPGVTIINRDKTQIKQTLDKYQLIKPFILSVGKLEPRKNIDRLIQAFKQLNNDKIDLVIVGPKGWNKKPLKEFNSKTDKHSNIVFLGFVSDEDLNSLYKSCLFFVYPSIWEGFGYPVIEAMKHKAAVATSNTSSLKEISGDAALLFDPFNIEDLYRCINTMIQNEDLRNKLAAKGKKQAEKFSWEKYYSIFINTLNI